MKRGKYIRTKEIREKMVKSYVNKISPLRGRKLLEKVKKRMSLGSQGQNPSMGMLGKHHSETYKRKMSEKFKGKNNPFYGKYHSEQTKIIISEKKKGQVAWCKDKHLSELHKTHLSESHIGIYPSQATREKRSKRLMGHIVLEETRRKIADGQRGEKGNNWQGGISKLPYPFEFDNELKELIRKRDDHTCQLCKVKQNGKAHDVHHIDYDKNNLNLMNLITLCHSCNERANHNRDYWKEYFTDFLFNRIIK